MTRAVRTFAAEMVELLAAARRFLVGVAFTVVVSGVGHLGAAAEVPVTAGASISAAAVTRLVDDGLAETDLPARFRAEMGYQPVDGGAGLARGDGGCSTPFGLGPDRFDEACKRHDLGYDLLRYAAARGEALGPWARIAVDRRLSADLASACDDPACRLLALAYDFAVTVNSVRQGFGPPNAEPLLPWAGLVVALAAVAWARTRFT